MSLSSWNSVFKVSNAELGTSAILCVNASLHHWREGKKLRETWCRETVSGDVKIYVRNSRHLIGGGFSLGALYTQQTVSCLPSPVSFLLIPVSCLLPPFPASPLPNNVYCRWSVHRCHVEDQCNAARKEKTHYLIQYILHSAHYILYCKQYSVHHYRFPSCSLFWTSLAIQYPTRKGPEWSN